MTDRTAKGPFTGQTYTAAWVPLSEFTASDGTPGCWTYRDERGYGLSLGAADNRHPTPEKALEAAVAHDVWAAACGDNSPLTREAYEAEVARLGGLRSWDDRDCLAMIHGDWDFRTYGITGAAERTLASRRGYTIRAERERKATPEQEARLDVALEAASLEAQAQDAEDNDQLGDGLVRSRTRVAGSALSSDR